MNQTSTDTSNTNQLLKEDKISDDLKLLKTENTKLKGEISLLRQNMLSLEKSNYQLRLDKSATSKAQILKNKKSEIELLKIQYKINENKPCIFKRPNTTTIDIKWALEHSNSQINFKILPFEYERLKFFKEYFFNEFYQFNTKIVLEHIKMYSKEKYKKFLDFFELFVCKIDVFNEFFGLFFINKMFINKKIKILNEIPVDWIINYKNGEVLPVLKMFIEKYKEKMIVFIYRVVVERPFLSNLLIDTECFTEMIQVKEYTVEFLKNAVCENGGLNLVSKFNIHLFSKDQLKKVYKDDYIDI
ncbi:uncharacterized protein VNE69_03142 [Vairimorpha necatrix]|uniref:Uncharacterized protein n=1 Tax=Vairimorpha necatrix TaxID=6039 RepID=A0AAX4JAN9_9MICR